MSLDKAILYGKEKRKPYYGTKSIAASCRNHGSCTYCKNGRLHKTRRMKEASDQRFDEDTRNLHIPL